MFAAGAHAPAVEILTPVARSTGAYARPLDEAAHAGTWRAHEAWRRALFRTAGVDGGQGVETEGNEFF